MDFVIKIISPKININRFFQNENPEKIILELIKLSNPNSLEKSIFIFPEGALSNIYLEDLKNYSYLFSENYSDQHKIVIGINSIEENKIFNSLAVLDKDLNVLAKYNKNKLVPFGEFLPFENFLSKFGIKKITQGYSSFSSDNKRNLINLNSINFLPLICYEIIYSGKINKNNKDFDLILNISEDGWFGNSVGPYQHFSKAIFRAIESNTYLLRSTNKGISAFINNKGISIQRLEPHESGNIELKIPLIQNNYKNKNDLIFFLLLFTYTVIFLTLKNRFK